MYRMARTTVCFLAVFVIFSAFAVPAVAELKIGYIRSDYIFSKYEPYNEAQKKLEAFHMEKMGELDTRYAELQKEAQDADSKALLMTDEIKRAKIEELQKREEELNQYHQNLYADDGLMAQKQKELIQPIIDKINEILMQKAENESYDYIFDASIGGTLLFANLKFDISEQILEELNKDISSQ